MVKNKRNYEKTNRSESEEEENVIENENDKLMKS